MSQWDRIETLNSAESENAGSSNSKALKSPTKKILVSKTTTTTTVVTTSPKKKPMVDENTMTSEASTGETTTKITSPKQSKSSPHPHSPSPPTTPKGGERRSSSSGTPRTPTSLNLNQITVTKRSWQTRSPGFASQSPRFPDPKSESPPLNTYQVETSSFREGSHSPSHQFKSTSPRFTSTKATSPSPTHYTVPDQEVGSTRRGELAQTAFKTTTKRFDYQNTKEKAPAVGHYNPVFDPFNSMQVNKERPSSPFKSASHRFPDSKSDAPSPTTYEAPTSFRKIEQIPPMSAFSSGSPRIGFQDAHIDPEIPSATKYDVDYSSFPEARPSAVPFNASGDRFRESGLYRDKKTPGPGNYHMPELPESLHTPHKK
jgi:hypothetical protein